MSWEADYARDFAAQKGSGPLIFSEDQRKKNLQLKALVKDLMPFDDDNKTSDCDLIYRFLIGRHWEVSAAEQMLRQYMKLRKEHGLNAIMAEAVRAEVQVVVSLIYGVDKDGQPVLWMTPDPAKLLPVLKSYPKEELLRAQMYVMEEARFISRVRGVDRCTYVIDMGKITMSSVNTLTLGFLRELMKVLQEYYPEIMRRLLIFNTGWAITGAWKVLKPLVDARVQDKIRFSNGPPTVKTLSEFMTPENVPPEYGGTGKGSVLDAPLQAEIARLRAAKAAPPPAAAVNAPVAAVPSAPAPAPPSPQVDARLPSAPLLAPPLPASREDVNTPKRESPRSLEAPEELPAEQLDEQTLYSLYTSFSPEAAGGLTRYPTATSPNGLDDSTYGGRDMRSMNSVADASGLRSFKSAVSVDDLDDTERDHLLAQFSSFYAVNDGYLRDDGDLSVSTDSGTMEALQEDEADGEGQEAPAVVAPLPHHADPLAATTGRGLSPDGLTLTGTTGDAVLAPPPEQAPLCSSTRSLPSMLSQPSGQTVTSVEVTLSYSADGSVTGYRGLQRVGEFRGNMIYGSPLYVLRDAHATAPQHRPVHSGGGCLLPVGDNDDLDGGAHKFAAVGGTGVLSTSFTPVARRVDAFPSSSTSPSARPLLHHTDGALGLDGKDDHDNDEMHNFVVGELLRESGHPIHSYVIACDAKRKARFVIRRSRLRSRVSVYQVVGDATVTTDGRVRHRIAGQKVLMGCAVAHSAPNARRDPSAWMLYGEDVTRPRKSLATSLWPFGKGPHQASSPENGEATGAPVGSNNALLAESLGQTVKFYGLLARSHPVDLFTLAMAISQLWLEGDGGTAPSGGGTGVVAGVSLGLRGLTGVGTRGAVTWSRHSGAGVDSESDDNDMGELNASGSGRPLGHSHLSRSGRGGGGGGVGGLAAVGDLLRGVGSKLTKSSGEPKSPTGNKPLR